MSADLSARPEGLTDAAPGSVSDRDRQVRVQKLELLYQQAAHGPIAALVVVSLWAALLWPHVPRERMDVWIALVLTTSAMRIALYGFYRRAKPQGEALLRWEWPFVATIWLFGIVCGVGAIWLTPIGSLQYLAVSYLFLIGMAGVSVSVFGAFIYIAAGVMLATVGPMVLWLSWHGGREHLLLAVSGALFLAMCARGLAVYHRALTRSMQLAIELQESHRIAEWHARTDALTGLYNRRAFGERADALQLQAQRDRQPSSILLIDVDGFKQINDGRGHAAGDAALRHLASALRQGLRASDVAARLGGDEFAVLLPATDADGARAVAETLQGQLVRDALKQGDGGIPISLSIGIATGTGSIESLLIEADLAMYAAKRAGKNQVAAAPG